MKKLTYLFLALIIVACSSDDSSDGNQLFMEKYDGIVWKDDLPNYDGKITFSNDISGIIIFDGGEFEDDEDDCRNLIFGEQQPVTDEDEDGNEIITGYATYTIQSELEDSMVLYLEGIDTNGNSTLNASLTCTVSSGGNALQVALINNEFPDTFDTENYTIAPDEFPCN